MIPSRARSRPLGPVERDWWGIQINFFAGMSPEQPGRPFHLTLQTPHGCNARRRQLPLGRLAPPERLQKILVIFVEVPLLRELRGSDVPLCLCERAWEYLGLLLEVGRHCKSSPRLLTGAKHPCPQEHPIPRPPTPSLLRGGGRKRGDPAQQTPCPSQHLQQRWQPHCTRIYIKINLLAHRPRCPKRELSVKPRWFEEIPPNQCTGVVLYWWEWFDGRFSSPSLHQGKV